IDAVIAARDVDALPMLFAEDEEVVEHTTGATYGRSGSLSFLRRQLVGTQGLTRRTEPLATLGDSLAVCRMSVSGSGAGGRTFDVGAFDMDNVCLFEVDPQGRRRRSEVYAAERLGDAVARLYERYAELLPDGPERARAAATARSVAIELGPFDLDRHAKALSPAMECVDHRTLGTWSARGAEAVLQHYRSLLEVADGVAMREDDILGLRSDALLVRRTHSGTDRAGGGAYERHFLVLWIFGSDGLIARVEQFDADRDAEALARFHELTAERSTTSRARRRVQPNAATANAARSEAVIAGRDADAFDSFFADTYEAINHLTGSEYGREGALATFRSTLKARDLTYRLEPLARLGNSLALCRQAMWASGTVGAKFDVGAYERDEILVIEVDEAGRRQRSEWF